MATRNVSFASFLRALNNFNRAVEADKQRPRKTVVYKFRVSFVTVEGSEGTYRAQTQEDVALFIRGGRWGGERIAKATVDEINETAEVYA